MIHLLIQLLTVGCHSIINTYIDTYIDSITKEDIYVPQKTDWITFRTYQ